MLRPRRAPAVRGRGAFRRGMTAGAAGSLRLGEPAAHLVRVPCVGLQAQEALVLPPRLGLAAESEESVAQVGVGDGPVASGRAVGEALAAALRRRGAPGPDELTRCFRQWAADGLFTRIELPPS